MVGLDDLARPTCASLNHPCLYLEAEFGKRLASRRPNQLLKHWDGDLAPKLALVRPTGARSPAFRSVWTIPSRLAHGAPVQHPSITLRRYESSIRFEISHVVFQGGKVVTPPHPHTMAFWGWGGTGWGPGKYQLWTCCARHVANSPFHTAL